jgi:uncharacterized membrane protein
MTTSLAGARDRLRGSLFFVPMLFVLGGAGLGLGMVALDDHLAVQADDLPFGISSTVASARAVVSTIAGATITVAGIAFSVSLLVIQQAAAQYSPRAVQGIFRDPFNKRIMGTVVGTFTYCLVVLRSIQSPDSAADPTVPNASVGLAVVLGIASILAIILFINHSAHRLDVSEILHVTAIESIEQVRSTWLDPEDARPAPAELDDTGDDHRPGTRSSLDVRFDDWGWVQRFDARALCALAPPRGVVRFDAYTGQFVVPGVRLCRIWPAPDDPELVARAAQAAVQLGGTRTVTQDASYGLRHLADIALRALSPGVNDPTTAVDAIRHLGVVVGEMLVRLPPGAGATDGDGRRLLVPGAPSAADVVRGAFDEVRTAAAPHPRVCIAIIETLRDIDVSVRHDVSPATRQLLRTHAERVVDECARESPSAVDLDAVEHALRTFATTALPPAAEPRLEPRSRVR